MLERVPAAAECTAHLFLRSVENPIRSSRVLDPRFWSHGAEDIESSSSTWWPSYLQQVRTVPQTRHTVSEDRSSHLHSLPSWVTKPGFLRHARDLPLHAPVKRCSQQKRNNLRQYSVSTPLEQGKATHEANASASSEEQSKSIRGIEPDVSQSKSVESVCNLRRNKPDSRHLPRGSLSPGSALGYEHGLNTMNSSIDGDRLRSHSLRTPPYSGISEFVDEDSAEIRRPAEHWSQSDSIQRLGQASRSRPLRQTQSRQHDGDDPERKPFPRRAVGTNGNLAESTSEFGRAEDKSFAMSSLSIGAGMQNQDTDPHPSWQSYNPLASLVSEGGPGVGARSSMSQPSKQTVKSDNQISLLQSTRAEDLATEAADISREAGISPSLASEGLVKNYDGPKDDHPSLQDDEAQTSNPQKAHLHGLLQRNTIPTQKQYDGLWSVFLSSDDQETLAPGISRLFLRSRDRKNLSRALTAFNIIPRSKRTMDTYQTAVSILLKQFQHSSAINLAFEASVMGFDFLPDLFIYLVNNLLWNSAAELLHRNRTTPVESASSHPAEDRSGAAVSSQILESKELVQSCAGLPDLHLKALSLAAQLRSQNIALTERRDVLKWLCQQLTIQSMQSQVVLTDITPQALLTVFDLEEDLGHMDLHKKALNTIFLHPQRSDKLDLALMTYRNFRFRHPEKVPSDRMIKGLISLCGDANHSSVSLYDYILDQYPDKPDRYAYQKVMTICARQGNITAVKKYMDRMVQDYGSPLRVAFVNPTIHAYAVNGDSVNARKQLDDLEKKFNLTPDTVSWNMLMLAHVRSDNDISAFEVLDEMRAKGVQFNPYTYGQLLSVCATHGDVEAALDLLVDARDDDIEISIPMISTIVQTFLKNDKVSAALRFATSLSNSGSSEHQTRLWNNFVRYFAYRGQLNDLLKIRNLMARFKVRPDGVTYAAMMILLSCRQRTKEAVELLQEMRSKEKLPVTVHHYSIILNGFVAEGNRDMALVTFTEMKQRFPQIGPGANAAVLRMQTLRNNSVDAQRGKDDDGSFGIQVLGDLLNETSASEGYVFDPVSGRSQMNSDIVNVYFETVIRALMRSGSYKMAAQLMRYVEASQLSNLKRGPGKSVSSRGMILAQMEVAMERRDWTKLEELWNSAFQNAVKTNGSVIATGESRKAREQESMTKTIASSSGRYSLASYLNRYMEGMARQGRQREMLDFFRTKLWARGFAFTGKNWNKYIQVLCRSQRPRDQVRAFESFERIMRRRVQSWNLLIRGNIRKRVTTYRWEPYRQRARPILQKDNRYRIVKRADEMRLHPQRKIPTYLTAVYLASVLKRAHMRLQAGSPFQFDFIRAVAPRSKRFIQQMPLLKEPLQKAILRQSDRIEHQKARPRSERKHRQRAIISGLLSDMSPLDDMPFEFLADIEKMVGTSNNVRKLLKNAETGDSQGDDVKLGEALTGQIARGPIVHAKKGRLENTTEMNERICREEQEKRDIVRRLRQDLGARALTHDVHRLPWQAKPPLDLGDDDNVDQKADAQSPGSIMTHLSSAPARALMKQAIGGAGDGRGAASGGETAPLPSVSRQLAELAQTRVRREEEKLVRPLPGSMIPQLALEFMNRRRLRHVLALRQRRQSQRLLKELQGNVSWRASRIRTAAGRRLRALEQARRRRRAVRAYRHDLEAGRRLDPFPKTYRGWGRRQFLHGGVHVRFVDDIGRRRKNYLVRRGILYDRRQRRVQTSPSKGVHVPERVRSEELPLLYKPVPSQQGGAASGMGANNGIGSYRPFQ